VLGIVVVLAVTGFVLHRTYLLNDFNAGVENAPTLPVCNGTGAQRGLHLPLPRPETWRDGRLPRVG
jgi:hypothetical protein